PGSRCAASEAPPSRRAGRTAGRRGPRRARTRRAASARVPRDSRNAHADSLLGVLRFAVRLSPGLLARRITAAGFLLLLALVRTTHVELERVLLAVAVHDLGDLADLGA